FALNVMVEHSVRIGMIRSWVKAKPRAADRPPLLPLGGRTCLSLPPGQRVIERKTARAQIAVLSGCDSRQRRRCNAGAESMLCEHYSQK
ncbi:hypothetical protein LLH00_16985, partial [bacterium]|nr:hypothetical protein [bacterium]